MWLTKRKRNVEAFLPRLPHSRAAWGGRKGQEHSSQEILYQRFQMKREEHFGCNTFWSAHFLPGRPHMAPLWHIQWCACRFCDTVVVYKGRVTKRFESWELLIGNWFIQRAIGLIHTPEKKKISLIITGEQDHIKKAGVSNIYYVLESRMKTMLDHYGVQIIPWRQYSVMSKHCINFKPV